MPEPFVEILTDQLADSYIQGRALEAVDDVSVARGLWANDRCPAKKMCNSLTHSQVWYK